MRAMRVRGVGERERGAAEERAQRATTVYVDVVAVLIKKLGRVSE